MFTCVWICMYIHTCVCVHTHINVYKYIRLRIIFFQVGGPIIFYPCRAPWLLTIFFPTLFHDDRNNYIRHFYPFLFLSLWPTTVLAFCPKTNVVIWFNKCYTHTHTHVYDILHIIIIYIYIIKIIIVLHIIIYNTHLGLHNVLSVFVSRKKN